MSSVSDLIPNYSVVDLQSSIKATQEQGLHHTQSMMQPLVYNNPNEGRGYSGT